MQRYDIAIIGTGPAGVSAAITAKIRGKNIVLFGQDMLSSKIRKAERIENYTGLPAISGTELAQKLKEHLDTLDISVTEKQVSTVYAMGDYFALQAGEDMYEAKTVIVASGVVHEKTIEGEDKFLGRGVSYCATCDGRFYKGKTVAVIGSSSDAPEEAEYLAELAEKVIYIPLKGNAPAERDNLSVLREKPLEIIGDSKLTALKTDGGEYEVSGIFIIRDAVLPDKLIPGIETDGSHIKVDIEMKTNIDGLFACGDIAGRPYQYIKAAGQGNIAALSAVSYLNIKK